jgi:hypothetical protein
MAKPNVLFICVQQSVRSPMGDSEGRIESRTRDAMVNRVRSIRRSSSSSAAALFGFLDGVGLFAAANERRKFNRRRL